MQRFYLDTAIWRDYFEDRKDSIRPLGEFAFQFLKKCQLRKWIVFVSPEIEKELLTYYSKERLGQVFLSFKDIIVKIDYSKQQVSEALSFWSKTNRKFPFSGILHSIIARDKAAILVCRDAHFWEIKLADCILPEEID
jgi:hypothetical protein